MPFRRSCNCCCQNHPSPITCCSCQSCTENQVVNPALQGSFGFFNNVDIGSVANNGTLPVNLVQSQGSGISSNGSGAISLSAGNYEVSYFAQGTVPVTGRLSVGLELNGVLIEGSQITSEQEVGSVETLSQTVLISVTDNSTLELVNLSGQNTTFSTASVFVRRL